jgi:hypothetical protein
MTRVARGLNRRAGIDLALPYPPRRPNDTARGGAASGDQALTIISTGVGLNPLQGLLI